MKPESVLDILKSGCTVGFPTADCYLTADEDNNYIFVFYKKDKTKYNFFGLNLPGVIKAIEYIHKNLK